jgi:hypothetical protein
MPSARSTTDELEARAVGVTSRQDDWPIRMRLRRRPTLLILPTVCHARRLLVGDVFDWLKNTLVRSVNAGVL